MTASLEDKKILKKVANKIKRIAGGDVKKINNELTRTALTEVMLHITEMLDSAAKEKDGQE